MPISRSFDALTGEMNCWRLSEVLEATIEEAGKLRSSCGFLLVAIDNLGRINEAYGFDVADEVIAAVSKRVRAHLRGKDHLGRFSGNKFGIILNNCTPDDMLIAADRLLVNVRDQVVQTAAGPVAVTVTIGGVTAPRHARTARDVLSRAQDALDSAKAKRRGSFQPYVPNLEREAQRRENVRATEEIITALNGRRIFLVYEPVVAIGSRQPAFYECLMRIKRADGSLLAVNEVVPLAERLGLVRMLDHRVLELALAELVAAPDLKASVNVSAASTVDPDWWGALGAMLRAHPGSASVSPWRSPRRRRSRISTTPAASWRASRISAAASRSTISARATRHSAICASLASISSRSMARSCRISTAPTMTAPLCIR